MSSDLTIVFLEEPPDDNKQSYKHRNTPFANSEIYFTSITRAKKLTDDKDVKIVYKVALSGAKNDFFPGDTIGILPTNNENLVDQLFERLRSESVADKPCELRVSSQNTKKNAAIPKHIPPQSTLRYIFLNHVDIHSPPKKLFLKALVAHTTDPQEKAKLQQICAPKASQEYAEFIGGQGATLAGLLEAFPSCLPPVEVLLQHLPPLQPRFYSISSSPLLRENRLEITFFVVEFGNGRKGVCTGWLEQLIENKIDDLVPIYFRQINSFRLPQNFSRPLILVATGTGIAPFRGFLQHRSLLHDGYSNIWLFYGCRYHAKDCLYKEEIDYYLKCGVLTRVDYAFSREGPAKIYVQNRIEEHGQEFIEWLLKKDAKMFVCGDARTVLKGVKGAVANNLVKYGGMSESKAEDYLKKMQSQEKFVADMWG